jgi:uncharacterized protein YlxW (UPF0749 family)
MPYAQFRKVDFRRLSCPRVTPKLAAASLAVMLPDDNRSSTFTRFSSSLVNVTHFCLTRTFSQTNYREDFITDKQRLTNRKRALNMSLNQLLNKVRY